MTDVGDWRIPTLAITPADGTTAVTLQIEAPDGTLTSGTPGTPVVASGSATVEAAGYELTQAGEWIERWTVTGTGKGKQRNAVLVAPDPATVPSGQRIYATTAHLADWLRTAPWAGARGALAAASRVVDEMLLCAVYDVDGNGLPTDAAEALAIRWATCEQARYARAAGDAESVGASSWASLTIGPVSVSRGSTPAGSSEPGRWSLTAWRLLQEAGLTNGEPQG